MLFLSVPEPDDTWNKIYEMSSDTYSRIYQDMEKENMSYFQLSRQYKFENFVSIVVDVSYWPRSGSITFPPPVVLSDYDHCNQVIKCNWILSLNISSLKTEAACCYETDILLQHYAVMASRHSSKESYRLCVKKKPKLKKRPRPNKGPVGCMAIDGWMNYGIRKIIVWALYYIIWKTKFWRRNLRK
jgi:hypothetical protein